LCDVGRIAVTVYFKLDFFTFIFAVLLHLLIFKVDVDYSFFTHARELKIVRLPSFEWLCKYFGDFRVLCELK